MGMLFVGNFSAWFGLATASLAFGDLPPFHVQVHLFGPRASERGRGSAKGWSLTLAVLNVEDDRIRATEGGYEPIIEALGDINVGRFAMEFAAPQSHGVESLSLFPSGKTLGLGVIDHCDPIVETPEVVVERAEAALKYVDAQNVTINPDCGFSPGAQNPMDLDEAYAKLTAMCEGAAILRERHGGG